MTSHLFDDLGLSLYTPITKPSFWLLGWNNYAYTRPVKPLVTRITTNCGLAVVWLFTNQAKPARWWIFFSFLLFHLFNFITFRFHGFCLFSFLFLLIWTTSCAVPWLHVSGLFIKAHTTVMIPLITNIAFNHRLGLALWLCVTTNWTCPI